MGRRTTIAIFGTCLALSIGCRFTGIPVPSAVVSYERDVAPPCPPPKIDTAGWQRIDLGSPVTFLVPPTWSAEQCERPMRNEWCGSRPGERVRITVLATDPGPPVANLDPHPTLHFARCQETIAGTPTWLAVGINTGYSAVAHARGQFSLEDGRVAVVWITGERRRSIETALMILRTVRRAPAAS